MSYILILEDERVLRDSMIGGLSGVPQIECAGFGTVREALAALEDRVPDLVLSDLMLPDGSGLDLFNACVRLGRHVPFVFITGHAAALIEESPLAGRLTIIEKPVSLEQLRKVVSDELSQGDDKLEPLTVGDLLLLLSVAGLSAQLVLEEGSSTGIIEIVAGEVWTAEDDDGRGPEALRRLFASGPRGIRCTPLARRPKVREIESGWEETLGTSGAAACDGAEMRAAQVVEEAVSALLSRDLARAYELFCEAESLGSADRRVSANLARLVDMGFGSVDR